MKHWIGGSAVFWGSLGRRRNQQETAAGGGGTGFLALALGAAGGYLLLTALGQVKIGALPDKMGQTVAMEDEKEEQDTEHSKLAARRLGFLERWYVAHSRSGMHTGFVLGLELQQTSSSTGVVTTEQLLERLMRVTSKFPWLRCKVRRDGVDGIDSRSCLVHQHEENSKKKRRELWGDDLFVKEEATHHEPSVRHVVPSDGKVSLQDGLQKVLQEESVEEWHDEDPSQPMWRVTLVTYPKSSSSSNNKRFALVLAFHHLITDGVGAMEVLRAIVLDDRYASPSVMNQQQQLPPPMEDVFDTTPTMSHMFRLLFWYTFPTLNKWFYPSHWKGNTMHRDYSKATDRKTELLCCSSIVEDSEMLRNNFCRPHQVSLNSVLVATLVQAIASVEKAASASPTMMCFKLQVSADERRRRAQQVSPHQLGSYVTGPQVYLNVSSNRENAKKSSIASLGREFQQKLRSAVDRAGMDIGMCRFIDEDWIQFAQNTLADERPNGVHDSLEVSFLDNVHDISGGADWMIDRLWFAQGRRGFGPVIIVTTINSGKSLNASLSFFPDALSREQLQKISLAWKQQLSALLN